MTKVRYTRIGDDFKGWCYYECGHEAKFVATKRDETWKVCDACVVQAKRAGAEIEPIR